MKNTFYAAARRCQRRGTHDFSGLDAMIAHDGLAGAARKVANSVSSTPRSTPGSPRSTSSHSTKRKAGSGRESAGRGSKLADEDDPYARKRPGKARCMSLDADLLSSEFPATIRKTVSDDAKPAPARGRSVSDSNAFVNNGYAAAAAAAVPTLPSPLRKQGMVSAYRYESSSGAGEEGSPENDEDFPDTLLENYHDVLSDFDFDGDDGNGEDGSEGDEVDEGEDEEVAAYDRVPRMRFSSDPTTLVPSSYGSPASSVSFGRGTLQVNGVTAGLPQHRLVDRLKQALTPLDAAAFSTTPVLADDPGQSASPASSHSSPAPGSRGMYPVVATRHPDVLSPPSDHGASPVLIDEATGLPVARPRRPSSRLDGSPARFSKPGRSSPHAGQPRSPKIGPHDGMTLPVPVGSREHSPMHGSGAANITVHQRTTPTAGTGRRKMSEPIILDVPGPVSGGVSATHSPHTPQPVAFPDVIPPTAEAIDAALFPEGIVTSFPLESAAVGSDAMYTDLQNSLLHMSLHARDSPSRGIQRLAALSSSDDTIDAIGNESLDSILGTMY